MFSLENLDNKQLNRVALNFLLGLVVVDTCIFWYCLLFYLTMYPFAKNIYIINLPQIVCKGEGSRACLVRDIYNCILYHPHSNPFPHVNTSLKTKISHNFVYSHTLDMGENFFNHYLQTMQCSDRAMEKIYSSMASKPITIR